MYSRRSAAVSVTPGYSGRGELLVHGRGAQQVRVRPDRADARRSPSRRSGRAHRRSRAGREARSPARGRGRRAAHHRCGRVPDAIDGRLSASTVLVPLGADVSRRRSASMATARGPPVGERSCRPHAPPTERVRLDPGPPEGAGAGPLRRNHGGAASRGPPDRRRSAKDFRGAHVRRYAAHMCDRPASGHAPHPDRRGSGGRDPRRTPVGASRRAAYNQSSRDIRAPYSPDPWRPLFRDEFRPRSTCRPPRPHRARVREAGAGHGPADAARGCRRARAGGVRGPAWRGSIATTSCCARGSTRCGTGT